MKERLLGFFDALRQAGLSPSVSETIDAAAAVAHAGVERPVLREVLAATLVKDHGDRPAFDDLFDHYFALPPSARGKAKPVQPAREGEGAGRGGPGSGRGREPQGERVGREPRREAERPGEESRESHAARALSRRRALLAKPFRDLDAREVEEVRALVEDLGHRFRTRLARRARRATRGRLDMRRTIRRALSRGGVPIEILLRRPRPGKSDLVALVDLSYSTATAADFLLALLVPARPFFRRVTLLGYVAAPAEISVEHCHVVPHEPLDLNARSDFGAVLRQLTERFELRLDRNTVLLVLGDARNNRLPPRADLLARLERRVRAVVWLNPEPPERWNTGDSVMATYARHVALLLAAWNPRTLLAALARLGRISA